MRKRVLFFLDNASIGRAAAVCRHFGARQPGSMHKQLRNLSASEATLRVRYHSIARYPGCPVPQQPPASQSVGASEWLMDGDRTCPMGHARALWGTNPGVAPFAHRRSG